MRFKFSATLTAALLLIAPAANAYTALSIDQIPGAFKELTANKALANPAVVLLDVKSGQVVFSRDADSPRKPASTLKLISAMSEIGRAHV